MGGMIRERYGLSRQETLNLSKRYYKLDGKKNWDSTDSFILWCVENGYQKGVMMRKHDIFKPHSPENSFFGENTKEKIRINSEKFHQDRNIVSPFCTGCEKECPEKSSGGCDEWKEYFKKNWNQNISIAPKKKPEPVEDPNTLKVFRYEHPDLVREGIVWQQTSQN